MIDGSFRENTGKTRLTETSRSETHACLFLSPEIHKHYWKRVFVLFIVLKKKRNSQDKQKKGESNRHNFERTHTNKHTQTHKHTNTRNVCVASAVSTHHHHRVMAARTKIPRGIRSSAAHSNVMQSSIRRLFRLVSSAVRNTTNNFLPDTIIIHFGGTILSNLRLRQRERR